MAKRVSHLSKRQDSGRKRNFEAKKELQRKENKRSKSKRFVGNEMLFQFLRSRNSRERVENLES